MPSAAPANEYTTSAIIGLVTTFTAQLSSPKNRRTAGLTRVCVFVVGLILILFVYVSQGLSQKDELKIGCDLKRFDPVVVSHALLNAIKKQVQPIYPPAARAVNASGEVEVQVVVNRSGDVIATCAISGHPLLRESAEAAAKQWRFKENFGYKYRQKRKYILSSITFRFDSDPRDEQQLQRPSGFLSASTSSAKVIDGSDPIVPLRTKRSEVETKLGPGEGECRCIYKTSAEVITVRYSKRECDEGWAVPPDTVIRVETRLVRPSKEPLSLVNGPFVRILDDATFATYINVSQGLVVHASPYDEVESMERIPTEAQGINAEFRCEDAGQYRPFTRYYPIAFNYKVRDWPNDVAEWNSILLQFKNLKEKRLYAFVYFDGTVSKDLKEQYIKQLAARSRKILGSKADVIIRYGGKRDRSEVEVFLLDRNLPEPSPSEHEEMSGRAAQPRARGGGDGKA